MPEDGLHELRDVRARDAGVFAAVLLATIAAVCLLTWWDLRALGGGRAAVRAGRRPPEPALQRDENDPREADELYRRQEELLATYGWVDRKRGVVRIPIARAIELYAAGRRR